MRAAVHISIRPLSLRFDDDHNLTKIKLYNRKKPRICKDNFSGDRTSLQPFDTCFELALALKIY